MKLARRIVFTVLLILGLSVTTVAAQAPNAGTVFSFEDPLGDSYGPGNYTYPLDPSFPQELPDMLDLVEFRVINASETTRYEFRFAQVPNHVQPWGGAGYNFHRIDLYVVWGGNGSRDSFCFGPAVQFKEAWQVNLRIRDWQGAYLRHWDDNPGDGPGGTWQGEREDFHVFVEGNAIIAELSHDLLRPAEPGWKYYVLVGLQDAYGEDHYRKIGAEEGPWTGGGASETEYSPNLYDILAENMESQKTQLAWEPGRIANLVPVGKSGVGSLTRYLAIGAVVLVSAGTAVLIWLFRKK